jgi:hypothetical protein
MYKQAQEALQNRLEKVAISTGFINQRLLNAAKGIKGFMGNGKGFKETGLADSMKTWEKGLAPQTMGKGKKTVPVAGPISTSPVDRATRNAEIRKQIARLRQIRAEQATKAMGDVEGKAGQKAVLKNIQAAGFVNPKVKQNTIMDTLNSVAARSQQNASRAGVSATMKNPWVNRGLMIGGGALGGGLIGSAMSSDPRSDNGQYA